MKGGHGDRRWYGTEGAGVLATIVLASIVCIGLSAPPAAASPCGAPGERACCNAAGEFSNVNTACDCGAVIASGCSGDCQCGGCLVCVTTGDHCEAVSPPCGGDGQRACCAGQSCSGPCASGLTEVNGCDGDCSCSNSHCQQATQCGGEGERACCGGELIGGVACESGLIELSGCTGDCFCGGSANPFGIDSSGHCVKPTHCGGDGERACCAATFEYAANTTAGVCETGKVPIFGCVGNCQCGGATAAEGVNSLETCITPTPCGGENQRGCCLSEDTTPCNSDLQAIDGCTGDCFCRGGSSSSTCVRLDNGKLKQISQPDTGRTTAPTAPRACGLAGYADLHVHMFADTAHGGGVLSGAPYDPANDDVNVALRPDYGTHRNLVSNTGGTVATPSCPPYISDCGEKLFHGDHTLFDDPVGTGTGDDTKSNLGAPNFTGWPTWHTTTHQQVYYKWLERAYQGGLRLISMLAVTNEALCLGNKHVDGTVCSDSMAAIDQQLDDVVAFEQFIDTKSGGAGKGWFHVVRTPAEARQAIADGQLAVVLGIEVDNLFNCHWSNRDDITGDCSTDGIRLKVKHYYDRGVRHVFPIHNFNNAFGGPATWQDAIDVGNRASEGHWWSPHSTTDSTPGIVDCSAQGYGFKLSCFMEALIDLLGFPASVVPLNDVVPCFSTAGATCNPIGLTSRGRDLVQALMDNGMIIDVDHMSIQAIDDTLAMALARSYPLVATHVQFFDLNQSGQRHERMRTRAQLEAIRDGGGMIAAMLKDDVQDSLGGKGKKANVAYTTSPSGTSIPDDCRHSTKTFAQMYQYAVDVMGRPVAFGSDFNGIAGHVGPRFGPDACGSAFGEWIPEYREGNRLQYPFDLAGLGEPGFGSFGKQMTGGKTFDFNVDGLAHVGLLPDLVADLAQVGLPQEYLTQLFGSAEEFVRVWEKSAGVTSGAPTAQCASATVTADATCQATASVATAAEQSDAALTLTQDPAGPYGLGKTPVTLTVASTQSCVTDTCTADVTVVDKTGPSMTCSTPAAVECAGATTPVSFAGPLLSDNCGMAVDDGCSPPSGSGFALGDNTVTCRAHDAAANPSSCTTTARVVDTKKPSITCPNPQTLECTGSQRATATFAASASDVCAGTLSPSCSPASGGSFPLGTTSVACSATDPSSNTSQCGSSVTVVDTTPPTITCPAVKVLECTGGNGATGTVTATASDVCWGTLSPTCSPGAGAFYPLGTTPVNCSVTDGSNLGAKCGTSVRVVDTTRPKVVCSVTTDVMNNPSGPNHLLLGVGFAASATDVCNGARPVTVQVFGNEDDQTPTGDGVFSPDAANIAPGTLRLRYERVGSGTGRVYLIVTKATDSSGNVGAACCTVAVPVSSSASSIAAVKQAAAAVRTSCLAGNGVAPARYFVVGDGPVVGSKQ